MTKDDRFGARVTWFGLSLLTGACFGGTFAQGLPCTGDADCGPRLRCLKQAGQTEGLCGGQGDPALCGNGLRDAGEACDDGDLADGDDCTPECRTPVCGDGFLAPGEGCDDGNTADGDGCNKDCQPPAECGDGVVDAGEACDDGNNDDGDACTPVCRLPVCGDGFLGPGEPCDDGNDVGTDECTPTCSLPACDDGYINGDDACDDGNAVDTDECTTVCTLSPEVPTFALNLAQVKQFEFSWTSRGAEYYQLFERAEPGQEFLQLGDDILGDSYSLTVPLLSRVNATYRLRACNAVRCVESELSVTGTLAEAVGRFKASNTNPGDWFGASVAFSGDGDTLAVGAPQEGSQATGIDGDQSDNSAPHAGAVYVFERTGATWSQHAYIKASNTDAGDEFGKSVALSEDGDTLAVGAHWERSQATGIDNGQDDNSSDRSGAVYVFARTGETWSQQAYVKASNTYQSDQFGERVALSGDGDTLAVGAIYESSQATGINNGQDDHSLTAAGAVYVFVRTGGSWSQQAYIKASNTSEWDQFGASVALSGDGDTLAVGAIWEDSQATGINGDQGDNSAPEAGAVYVFVRVEETWSQQAYVKPSNTQAVSWFGTDVALSTDGNILAVGAPSESFMTDEAVNGSGAVHLFVRTGDTWSQQARVEAANPGLFDQFGTSVALSGDGSILAAGAAEEDSRATGLNGDSSDEDAQDAGAAYVFVRVGDDWSQTTYVKASNTNSGDLFGKSVALSGDGAALVVGAPKENYDAESGNLAFDAGAVYLY